MTELCAIAEHYLVDKCPKLHHTYTPLYHNILNEFRNNITTVLEIGIGNYPLMSAIVGSEYVPGASLRMWKDYFKYATVYGCDIDKSTFFTEDRIKTLYVDQSNPESLNMMIDQVKTDSGKSSIDFIIDDGSHNPDHQKITFEVLWKHLSPGGIYIIEDIQGPWFPLFETIHEYLGFMDAHCIKQYSTGNYWDNFIAFKKLG